MAQRVATLEILLEMATGQAVTDILKYGSTVDATMKGVIDASNKADAAISAMGGGSGAAANVVKSTAEMRREMNAVERAGESMVRQLESQVALFGKTSTEIRNTKVELAALAAEQRGMMELADRLRTVGGAINELEAAGTRGATGVGKTSFALRMTAMQIPDIVQGLLTGQKPMQVFLQQGGQIAQIAQMAEGGVRGFASEIVSFGVRLAPVILSVGALAAGFLAVKSQLSDDAHLKKYAAGLGLTHDEMKKLKDVSVTTGDIMVGIWKTLNSDSSLGSFITRAKKWFAELRDDIVYAMRVAGTTIYAAFAAAFNGSLETWRHWPGALADLTIQGVNHVVDALNVMAQKANQFLGRDVFGSLGHIQNDFVGQAAAVGSAYAEAFQAAFKQAWAFTDRISANIQQAARDRLKAEADEISYDRRAAAAKAARDKAAREAEEQAKRLAALQAEIIFEHGKMLADLGERLSKPFDFSDTTKRVAEQLALIAKYDPLRPLKDDAASLADHMAALANEASRAGYQMEQAFGRVGGALSSVVSLLAEYGARQAEIAKQAAAAGSDQQKFEDLARESAQLRLSTTIGLIDASKNLFKEHSAGYRAMEAAEKALAAVQLARTAIAVAEGAAQMFATLGPAGFVAVAAMLGVMAAVGFSGGHEGTGYSAPTNGAGSVLGDSGAKSDSLKAAMDDLRSIDDATLGVSRDMLVSLRAIQTSIGTVAGMIGQQLGLPGGAFDTSGLGLGSSRSSGSGTLALAAGGLIGVGLGKALGLDKLLDGISTVIGKIPVIGGLINGITSALFGTKPTVSLLDQGLSFAASNVGDILANGISGSTYQDVQTKKTKHLFGISTGSSTSINTQYGNLDDYLETQIGLLVGNFRSAIVGAAGALGDDVSKALDDYTVSIGKISLKDLKGSEIEDALNAVFSKLGDDMAAAALPSIKRFQKVGEGAFQTLVRVATTVEQVDAKFRRLGRTTTTMGVDIDMAIADLFDSVGQFSDLADRYFEAFYSPAEQVAAKTNEITRALRQLGLGMPSTLAGYRALVDAQDLTTDAGRETYASLLQLSGPFADLIKSMNDASSAAAEAAASIANQRDGLVRQLLQLQGDTTTLRAMDLANLDESNRALQQQIYALQDAQAAAQAADQLRQAWASVGDSIMDEVKRIRGLTETASGGSFASLLGQFNAANAAARSGDIDAAKLLPDLSKSLLGAAADAATSQQELLRVQAQTAQQLEDTLALIGGSTSSADPSAWFASISGAQGGSAGGNNDLIAEVRALRTEVAQLRTDTNNNAAQIAQPVRKLSDIMQNVTNDSGGTAIATEAA